MTDNDNGLTYGNDENVICSVSFEISQLISLQIITYSFASYYIYNTLDRENSVWSKIGTVVI